MPIRQLFIYFFSLFVVIKLFTLDSPKATGMRQKIYAIFAQPYLSAIVQILRTPVRLAGIKPHKGTRRPSSGEEGRRASLEKKPGVEAPGLA